jgi:hypothetical protein
MLMSAFPCTFGNIMKSNYLHIFAFNSPVCIDCNFMFKLLQVLLQKMPHIIPHEERVQLFRRYVANEKTVLGLTESACVSPQSTLITVHR